MLAKVVSSVGMSLKANGKSNRLHANQPAEVEFASKKELLGLVEGIPFLSIVPGATPVAVLNPTPPPPSPTTTRAANPAPSYPPLPNNWKKLPKAPLIAICTVRSLSTKGSKADLIARITVSGE